MGQVYMLPSALSANGSNPAKTSNGLVAIGSLFGERTRPDALQV